MIYRVRISKLSFVNYVTDEWIDQMHIFLTIQFNVIVFIIIRCTCIYTSSLIKNKCTNILHIFISLTIHLIFKSCLTCLSYSNISFFYICDHFSLALWLSPNSNLLYIIQFRNLEQQSCKIASYMAPNIDF